MPTASSPSVAIVGGGVGGLALAVSLSKMGIAADLYEQASAFREVGAGIHMTPNAIRALDGMGLGHHARRVGHPLSVRINRRWDTGEISSQVEIESSPPHLGMHRAQLLDVLLGGVDNSRTTVHLGHRLVHLEQDERHVELQFSNGSTRRADIVVGADGVHSRVQFYVTSNKSPQATFTGIVAFRATVPSAAVAWPVGYTHREFNKWFGPRPQSQLVAYPIGGPSDEIFISGAMPQADWDLESWSFEVDASEFRDGFDNYHYDARKILGSVERALKTALYDRVPLPVWAEKRITLLGDACHPLVPFMGQGAAMALEDAVMLSRCLNQVGAQDFPEALKRYEAARQGRTAAIQLESHRARWLKDDASDVSWVFGYDAWTADVSGSSGLSGSRGDGRE